MINFTGTIQHRLVTSIGGDCTGNASKKCHDDSGLGLIGKFANKIAEDEVVQVVHFH